VILMCPSASKSPLPIQLKSTRKSAIVLSDE
jgi:hypothetical protein